jgi:hypothetical protein
VGAALAATAVSGLKDTNQTIGILSLLKQLPQKKSQKIKAVLTNRVYLASCR